MDAKLKADWLAALRGGEYKQCQDVLHKHRTRQYCCLGVLAKIANLHTAQQLADGVGGWETFGGLDEEDGTELAAMNDSGKSFSEIADWIEANVPVSSNGDRSNG